MHPTESGTSARFRERRASSALSYGVTTATSGANLLHDNRVRPVVQGQE